MTKRPQYIIRIVLVLAFVAIVGLLVFLPRRSHQVTPDDLEVSQALAVMQTALTQGQYHTNVSIHFESASMISVNRSGREINIHGFLKDRTTGELVNRWTVTMNTSDDGTTPSEVRLGDSTIFRVDTDYSE